MVSAYESRLESIANADWDNNYVSSKGKVKEKNIFCQLAKGIFNLFPIKPLVKALKPFVKPFKPLIKPFKPLLNPFIKTAKNVVCKNDASLKKASHSINHMISSVANSRSTLTNDQKVDLAFRAAYSFNKLLSKVEKKKGMKKGSLSKLKITDQNITNKFKHLFETKPTEKRKESPIRPPIDKEKQKNLPDDGVLVNEPIKNQQNTEKDEVVMRQFLDSLKTQSTKAA